MNEVEFLLITNILEKNPTLRKGFFTCIEDFFDASLEEKENFKNTSFCSALIALDDCITTLIKNDKCTEDSSLAKIFQDIEEELINVTDSSIENDFEICFFESLLNSLAHGPDEHIEKLSKVLGPKSRELCINNDEFWGTKLIK